MTPLPHEPALVAVIEQAVDETRRRRHGQVTVEHLLWTLLRSPRGAAVIVGAGGELDPLLREVALELGPAAHPDARFARVLARASLHAEAAGRTEVTIDGVIAAIYAEDVGALLIDHGVPRLAVLDFICHGLTTVPRHAAPLPRAWWRRTPTATPVSPPAAPVADLTRSYRVVVHNDDYTTRELVVAVLTTVFDQTVPDAAALMEQVHARGAAVVGTYPRDAALDKSARAVRAARAKGYPLRVSTEPAD